METLDGQTVVDPDLSQGEPDWNSASSWLGIDSTSDMPHTLNVRGPNTAPDFMQGGIDEIRIATSWQGAIPEPGTMALMVLGSLAMLCRRRCN